MIIEFAVTNFRSIKDRQIMSFKTDGQIGNKHHSEHIVLPKDRSYKSSLVKSMVIYGANASGKSNFLKAFKALEFMVVNSDGFKLDKTIPTYEPFKLDKSNLIAPTIFEIEFIAKDQKRYRYEIEFNKTTVLKEELYVFELDKKATQATLVFSRKADRTVKWNEKRDISLNPNELLLSKTKIDDKSMVEAYRFFSTHTFYGAAQNIGFDESMLKGAETIFSNNSTEHSKLRNLVVSLIQAADVGITDVFTQDLDVSKISGLPEDMSEDEKIKLLEKISKRIKTRHDIYENGIQVGQTVFDLSEESTGTRKLLGLATVVADALFDGSVVIIDEMDKNLHPLLTRMIIGLFHNPEFNKNNAQLIFSTHDVSLIDVKIFRRDQIMLIDKDQFGASSVKRLSDFTGISRVIPLEKWYLAGMFNAIPAINEYQIEMN